MYNQASTPPPQTVPTLGMGTPIPHLTPFGASILSPTALDLGASSTLLAVYTHLYF